MNGQNYPVKLSLGSASDYPDTYIKLPALPRNGDCIRTIVSHTKDGWYLCARILVAVDFVIFDTVNDEIVIVPEKVKELGTTREERVK